MTTSTASTGALPGRDHHMSAPIAPHRTYGGDTTHLYIVGMVWLG